jgi:hypothetical protein
MPNTKPIGVAYEDPQLDGAILGKSDGTVGFYGTTPIAKPAALTTQLTSITIADAAGTPDYALSALTTTSPYGLATKEEAVTLLYVIKNLQVRVAELETKVKALGLIS